MGGSTAAKLAEIERRYKRKRGQFRGLAALRISDLNRLFRARYGEQLPNDDAGRDDVTVMVHHLAVAGGQPVARVRSWVSLRAPWMPVGELDALTKDALINPRRWRADRLAWRLRLTETDRRALKITTIGAIDANKDQRKASRLARARVRHEAGRRARGSMPRHEYEAKAISRAKPWEAEGVSRAQWYRRMRQPKGE